MVKLTERTQLRSGPKAAVVKANGKVYVVTPQRPAAPPRPERISRRLLGVVTSDSGRFAVTDAHALDWDVVMEGGLGGGTYEVYGTYQHIPGYGERLTKAEIEFIPDWELAAYHAQEEGT